MLSFDNTYGPKFQVISITDILTRFFSHRKRKKEEIAPPFFAFLVIYPESSGYPCRCEAASVFFTSWAFLRRHLRPIRTTEVMRLPEKSLKKTDRVAEKSIRDCCFSGRSPFYAANRHMQDMVSKGINSNCRVGSRQKRSIVQRFCYTW